MDVRGTAEEVGDGGGEVGDGVPLVGDDIGEVVEGMAWEPQSCLES